MNYNDLRNQARNDLNDEIINPDQFKQINRLIEEYSIKTISEQEYREEIKKIYRSNHNTKSDAKQIDDKKEPVLDNIEEYTFTQKIIYSILSSISALCYFMGWVTVLGDVYDYISVLVKYDFGYGSLSLYKLFFAGIDFVNWGNSIEHVGWTNNSILFTLIIATVFLSGLIALANFMYKVWMYRRVAYFNKSLGFALCMTIVFILTVIIINFNFSSIINDYYEGYIRFLVIDAAPIVNIVSLTALLVFLNKDVKFSDLHEKAEVVKDKLNNKVSRFSDSENNTVRKPQEKIICSKCNSENSITNKFCYNCGKNLEKQRFFCSKCGNELGNNTKFCPNCGTKQES